MSKQTLFRHPIYSLPPTEVKRFDSLIELAKKYRHFRFDHSPFDLTVSCLIIDILFLLLAGGAPDVCFSAEPKISGPAADEGVTETEQINPNFALERSEQKFLRYAGKRITSIRIKRLEVFDASVNDTTRVKTSRLKKALNRVNFNTRDTTIRQSLLFKEGDSIDPYILADSERLLRYLDFIQDARIVVITDKADKNNASIMVIVKDQWSIDITGGLKKGNGFQLSTTERNLFGLGHQVSTSITGVPHTTSKIGLSYAVQNIQGSFITGKLSYLKVPDNNTVGLELSRELVSPVLKYSGGLELSSTVIKIHDSLPYFDDNSSNLRGLWVGRTIHFAPTKKDRDHRRSLVISGRFRQVIFTKHPAITDSTWYRYHDKSYYLANVAFIQNRYYLTNLLYSYGRTENIPYGFLANLTSGMLNDHIRSRLYVSTTLAAGNRIKRLGYGAAKLSFSGCPRGKTIELGILKLESLYFTDIMHSGKFRFRQFLRTEYVAGINRFSDDSIDFSVDENIRGVVYNHTVTGSKRLSLSLETVAFTPWKAYGFNIAVYSFADMDVISPTYKKIITHNFYSGLGLGVRIHSETIGIATIQVRFAWYPNLPLDHKAYAFTSSRENRILPIDFIGSKPEILEY